MLDLQPLIKASVKKGLFDAYVSRPAFVHSFNAGEQTITAQLAIMHKINGEDVPIALIVNMPIIFPTVQNYHITMPVKAGDEVLCVFADRCIDDWLLTGEVSSQRELRVHDINDGFAIVGINSRPNNVQGYSADNLEIRNSSNDQSISLQPDGVINISTTNNINVLTNTDVSISCENATVQASSAASIECADATITTDTMAITCSASFSLESPIIDITGATAINLTAPAMNFTAPTTILCTTPLLSVSGLVGCAGIGAGLPPVPGEGAFAGNMSVGGQMLVTGTINGVQIETHTHNDAEGRVTTPPL